MIKTAAVVLALATACGPAPVVVREQPFVAAPPATARTVAPRAALPHAALPPGCSSRAAACVSTAAGVAWLQTRGRPSYGPVQVSLGSTDHPTPRGTFHVAWKDEEHTSSTYGIPMPYSVFFASGGVAFHEGPQDEASHGCVHLARNAALAFFSVLERGDRVEVF